MTSAISIEYNKILIQLIIIDMNMPWNWARRITQDGNCESYFIWNHKIIKISPFLCH